MNAEIPTGNPPWAAEAVVRRVITESQTFLALGDHPTGSLWMGLFPNLRAADCFTDHWMGGDGPWMELCSVLDRVPFIPFAYGFTTIQEGFEQLATLLATHFGITFENHLRHSGQLRLLQPIVHPAFDTDTGTWGTRVSDYPEVFEELMALLASGDDLHTACDHHKEEHPIIHHLLYSK